MQFGRDPIWRKPNNTGGNGEDREKLSQVTPSPNSDLDPCSRTQQVSYLLDRDFGLSKVVKDVTCQVCLHFCCRLFTSTYCNNSLICEGAYWSTPDTTRSDQTNRSECSELNRFKRRRSGILRHRQALQVLQDFSLLQLCAWRLRSSE